MSADVTDAFKRSLDSGESRLERSWSGLLATGVVGGLDVSVGVFAMFIVRGRTGNELLGALAFSLGFIALTLAHSELFTENFLVPVVAVVAGRAGPLRLARLWGGTLVTNLIGGWIAMGLVMSAFPDLRRVAVEVGTHPTTLGIGWTGLASAIIAGAAITLMTWMEQSTDAVVGKLTSAVGIGFLLAAAPLQHAIVISVEMFAALQVGAHFGYLDWLGTLGWAIVGNILGGVGLVTVLRMVQVPRHVMQAQSRRT